MGEISIDYIAHKISGDVQGNINKVLSICHQLHVEEGILPFAPYIPALLYLRDDVPAERELGMTANGIYIRKACDRLRIFGDVLSFGVKGEALLFKELARPIILQNPALEKELDTLLQGYAFEVRAFQLKPEYQK